MPNESDPSEAQLIAGRYRLSDVLGRSLMSEVRRGEDLRLKRSVAIKLLRDDGDPRSVARFEREAQILARLHHPNIVTVFDTGVDGRDRFIVMELIEGPTLRQLLDDKGALGLECVTEIASGIASALGSAHAHGIVHRDVKPSNVLLPRDGGVKLVDMGIARLLSAEALTLTLSALGTARYMSPEQARGDRLDGRSDIYSLGCVLFEMLTGRTPFEGDPMALSYRHIHTPAPHVRSINTAVPAAMDDLVAAMLEKDAADRPQTAEDIQRSLSGAMVDVSVGRPAAMEAMRLPPPPPPRPPRGERPRPRRRAWPTLDVVLGGLLGLIILIALLASAGWGGRSSLSGPSPHPSESPTAEQSSPVDGGSPAPEQPSPQVAAAVVLDSVGNGVETGEITDDLGKEIDHTIDEILRSLGKDEDVEKSLEQVDGLREKVSEALTKGEITSPARASAIDEALLKFAQALRDAGQGGQGERD